ncbi:MAG: VTT domain-containing protein [Candidatus Woesearchaeota archaeon]
MSILNSLFEWTQGIFEPLGSLGLFILAFIESSFFPIPPDILLVVLALGNIGGAFWYALIATLGSVIGGIFGYGVGFFFGEVVLRKLVKEEKLKKIHDLFNKYEALAVLVAAVSPIPYKVVTIGAGVFSINFRKFVLYSVIGRGFRYFLEATLIFFIGDKLLELLKSGVFDWIALIVVVVLVVVYFVYKRKRNLKEKEVV